MFAPLLSALRRHPWLTLGFASASLAALAFLISALVGLSGWRDRPAEAMAGWMTVGYIARAHDLDPREIDRLAGLPPPANGRAFTLDQIAADRGVPVDEVMDEVREAIRSLKWADHSGEGE